MTDNEIVKALLECSNNGYNDNNGSCKNCPYIEVAEFPEKCMTMMAQNALEFINRQKAEIERLNKEVDLFADIGKMYSEIKAEAYKECIEKINKILNRRASFGSVTESLICESIILENNNLLKELVGENDETKII